MQIELFRFEVACPDDHQLIDLNVLCKGGLDIGCGQLGDSLFAFGRVLERPVQIRVIAQLARDGSVARAGNLAGFQPGDPCRFDFFIGWAVFQEAIEFFHNGGLDGINVFRIRDRIDHKPGIGAFRWNRNR